MVSKCIDDCVNIKSDAVCVRPGTTYANLHKWPMAEVEFIRSISHSGSQRRTKAAESISCRQMYLRSYTFTRKENEEDGGGGGNASDQKNDRRCVGSGGGKKKAPKKAVRKSKMTSCRTFVFRLVWKCLSCASTTKVNNIDQ